MIFYFTGTGNSWAAAKTLAAETGEKLFSIAWELNREEARLSYQVEPEELVGFVFPVYAWGPPRIVLEFLRRMELSGGKPYMFSVVTCGEEEGRTTQILKAALEKKGLSLDSAFTLVMPNNFMIGFDVDSREVQERKLKQAETRLTEISALLRERKAGQYQLISGAFADFKSGAFYRLFRHFATNPKYFSVTEACNGCGLCASICPVQSINMDEIKEEPIWKGQCEHCLACINHCPQRAIQYGKSTVRKGRYVHPEYHMQDRDNQIYCR